ncbi:queuine tRNA-ribosyltransferase [Legionella lansingensis]|uniref:Queuine tRNA-ribosyltransferase n=1 Tax=Legionella lansingensis TaxID=45067 RepID=A0A0W0VU36_9GAMM|nr:hypothetical protein [Legionella lansingensis]KTD23554.1 queuine tRNA-ribosyltransferase [Legionella lansingensis]SNV52212.1 queuine tRNA-ribosyltransferase [Legionella lansingensis]
MNKRLQKQNSYIPILTTPAGGCLTLANWQETGVQTVCLQLHILLLKPGVSLLNSLPNLKTYYGWQGTIVLDARLSPANNEGVYTILSPYDGSRVRIERRQLVSLIITLHPDIVLLPDDFDVQFLSSAPKSILPLIPPHEVYSISRDNSVYYVQYQPEMSFTNVLNQLKQYGKKVVYLAGDFALTELAPLAEYHLKIISDMPAKQALAGEVYSEGGLLEIHHIGMAHQHITIEKHCACPTCQQKLTRAYLHHLFLHTPLLCQRFLIQHNVYYYQHALQKNIRITNTE